MLSTHERIHGCEVKIPETYFFCKGRPKFLIKTDKNEWLSMMNIPEKLELTEIRKDLPLFVRNRRIKSNVQNLNGKAPAPRYFNFAYRECI